MTVSPFVASKRRKDDADNALINDGTPALQTPLVAATLVGGNTMSVSPFVASKQQNDGVDNAPLNSSTPVLHTPSTMIMLVGGRMLVDGRKFSLTLSHK